METGCMLPDPQSSMNTSVTTSPGAARLNALSKCVLMRIRMHIVRMCTLTCARAVGLYRYVT